MPSAEKVEKVAVLKERIRGSQTGFSVVKNTLLKLAAGEAGIADLGSLLEGPTAVAFVAGDPVSAAKKVVEAAKR